MNEVLDIEDRVAALEAAKTRAYIEIGRMPPPLGALPGGRMTVETAGGGALGAILAVAGVLALVAGVVMLWGWGVGLVVGGCLLITAGATAP